MNKLLTATLALLAMAAVFTTTGVDRKSQFEAWKAKHGLKYSTVEDLYRFKIYAQAVEEIEAHNADPTQTYKQGENQFTAMTQEEFASLLTLKKPENKGQKQVYIAPEDFQPLGAVNWGPKLKVKDQGMCGSCWAFSAVAAVEAFYKIKQNTALDLSEQELVDCDVQNYGCEGGWPDLAIEYISEYGIVDTSDYKYTSGKTGVEGNCKIDEENFEYATYVEGYYEIEAKAASVKSAVSKYPLSVLVDASNWSKYASGVFSNCAKDLNHAVLLVGYNTDDTWIIKNSWGTSWGEKGFMTLSAGNTCGIMTSAIQAY